MSPYPVLVPDASVLLKWVLESTDEEDRNRAFEIQEAWVTGKCAIVLPSLWFFEVGNILGLRQPRLAGRLMRVLIGYGFEEESHDTMYEKTFELMKAYKVTFYDAAYHSVAIKRSGTMITADASYYRKTSRAGNVALLGEWSSRRLYS